ncbi:alpha/beta hydrolase [Oscillatoria salina]|uniref:alpha/beta hydrolase n=1 Tax=Oscillatoria salina TaxID=331517 RepID=UPI001CC999CD|nr:alpha/beta fold hydrolase [Oscillatoria salina]
MVAPGRNLESGGEILFDLFMSNYATTIATILEQVRSREQTLPLRNQQCRSRFFLQPHPTAKVCLFFHGFTAAPYQFAPLGKALFASGYNVLVPLQPGHGIAGDWNGDNPPPLPTNIRVYQNFARDWLQIAQNLGEKIIIGGLSTGATLTGWLALNSPKTIDRALLFAPYLSSSLPPLDLLIEILPFYYEWANKDASGNFGYHGFPIPRLRLFYDLGQQLLEQAASQVNTPMLIVASDRDRVVSHGDEKALFKMVVQQQPKSWYHCFDSKFDIHHRMMTEMEGNEYQDLVIALAKAYINSEITWMELQEIKAFLVTKVAFEKAVSSLNLEQKVAPELAQILSASD